MNSTGILMFLLVIIANEIFGSTIIYSGPKGYIHQYDSMLVLNCNNIGSSMADAFPEPPNQTIFCSQVFIHNCQPPPTSYANELRSLHIDITDIVHIQLTFFEKNLSLTGNYMQDLKITSLSVISQSKENSELLKDFLEPLSKLSSLEVAGLQIPQLPSKANLETLVLHDGATLRTWGNCSSIIRNLILNNVQMIPMWPANCSTLQVLSLLHLSPEVLQDISVNISSGVANLDTFKVNFSKMIKLPYNILNAAKNLNTIIFSHNYLHDTSFSGFPVLESLTNLDLSYNSLTGSGLESLWHRLPKLSKLNLDFNNEFYRYCDGLNTVDDDEVTNFKLSLDILQNSPLETLSLDSTYIDMTSCFRNIHFSNLQSLILTGIVTNILKLQDIPKSDVSNLIVDFGDNTFVAIVFNETDYEELHQASISNETQNKTHLTLVMGPVPCDCKHSWLARALHDFPNILTIEDLRCSEDGTPILEQSLEIMECTKREYNDCLYRTRWRDDIVVAKCLPRTKQLPPLLTPLHGINVSGGGISTLHSHLPHTLQWVDLRYNSISRADPVAAAALFADGRRVWLGDNLLDCECHNALLDALLWYRDQVEDFDTLTCVGSGKALSEVSMTVLCQMPLKASLTTVGILLALVVIAALVWRQYGEPIRIFLYTRGICLCCLHQQDLDDDGMAYDAFLSFAHGDEEYVREQLLPGLERAPEQYRVCVHYRDWVIGEWIPAQILRSVQNSKRTLILLSRLFVRSWWSSLEFRYAVAHAAQQGGRPRLLVLVLDDVLEEPLDTELQSYLSNNTYLRCDDPWFWEKLRYAMPHNNSPSQKRTPDIKSPQDINKTFENIPLRTLSSEMALIPFSEPEPQPNLNQI